MPGRRRVARRPPQQDRSRATRDAILTAAARIFSSKGFEAATMNEIAEAAGVAIGSLYQHVSTKEDLAAEVIAGRSREIVAFLEPRLLAISGFPLAQGVRALVQLLIEAHRMHGRLRGLAFHEAPALADLERRVAVGVRVYLEAHQSEIRPRNLELAVAILTHALDAAVHGAIGFDGPELAQELEALVLGYLTGPR